MVEHSLPFVGSATIANDTEIWKKHAISGGSTITLQHSHTGRFLCDENGQIGFASAANKNVCATNCFWDVQIYDGNQGRHVSTEDRFALRNLASNQVLCAAIPHTDVVGSAAETSDIPAVQQTSSLSRSPQVAEPAPLAKGLKTTDQYLDPGCMLCSAGFRGCKHKNWVAGAQIMISIADTGQWIGLYQTPSWFKVSHTLVCSTTVCKHGCRKH